MTYLKSFFEVDHFIDQCLKCKHEMQVALAPYKEVHKDMQKKALLITPFVHKIFCLHLHHAPVLFEQPDSIHPRTPMSSIKHQYIYFDVISCSFMSTPCFVCFASPNPVFPIMSVIRKLGSSSDHSPGNPTFFPQANQNIWCRDCLRQLPEKGHTYREGCNERQKRKMTSQLLSTGKCCRG